MLELSPELLAEEVLNELVLHLWWEQLEKAILVDDEAVVVPEGPRDLILHTFVETAWQVALA